MANFGSLGSAFVDIRADTKKLSKDLRGARRNIAGSAQIAGLHAGQSFSTSFAKGLTGIGATIAGALGTREITRFADSFTVAGNKIAAASQVSGIQAKSLGELSKAAIAARSDFDAYVEIYSRLLRQGNQVKGSMEEIAVAADVVSKAFKAGGASALEQASGIIQLGQAIGSGFLQGDELRTLREAAPLLAQAIADEMGVAIGGLKELGAQGKLTSDVVFKALLAGRGKIEAQFAVTESTIADAFTNIRTAFTQYIGDTDDAIGATKIFVSTMKGLAENLDTVAKGALLIGAVKLGPRLAARTAQLGATVKLTAAEIAFQHQVLKGSVVELDAAAATAASAAAKEKSAMASLRAAKTAEFEAATRVKNFRSLVAENAERLRTATTTSAVVAAEKRLKASKLDLASAEKHLAATEATTAAATTKRIAATNAATAATSRLTVASRAGALAVRGFGAAVSFLGGPVGIALLGITALATGMIDLSDDSEDVAGAIDKLNSAVSDAEQSLGDLRKVERSLKNDTEALETANETLARAIRAGEAAATSAAVSEVEAIRQRIDGNDALKNKYLEILEVQRAIATQEASNLREAFNKKFAPSDPEALTDLPGRIQRRKEFIPSLRAGKDFIDPGTAGQIAEIERQISELERMRLENEKKTNDAIKEQIKLIETRALAKTATDAELAQLREFNAAELALQKQIKLETTLADLRAKTPKPDTRGVDLTPVDTKDTAKAREKARKAELEAIAKIREALGGQIEDEANLREEIGIRLKFSEEDDAAIQRRIDLLKINRRHG
jgi:tape measure domain-containing protein